MSEEIYIGSIDQGTTSSRFALFNTQGKLVAVQGKEHKQITPQPGWVEHDANEIMTNVNWCIDTCLKESGIKPEQVKSVGITNQRETTMMWSKSTGKPLFNAIVWQDTRTRGVCDALATESELGINRFRAVTGLPLASYFAATKGKWLMDNIPDVKTAIESADALLGTMDSWLIWKLTGGEKGGVHITDVTNASRYLLMDLEKLTWDSSICETFGIPMNLLPEIKSSSEIYGNISYGALQGIPLAGILGDQQAALFGHCCFNAGETKITYGTGCFLLFNTAKDIVPSKCGLLTTVAYQACGETIYALEGSVAMAGSLVQWLRDKMKLIEDAKETGPICESVDDTAGIYFVPAFSGLFAPYWRSDARGVIVGLTSYVERSHVVRATVESTAYQAAEIVEAMRKEMGIPESSYASSDIRVDGGMAMNKYLMQFQSDLLRSPILRPEFIEITALGAAYAAGLGVGIWKSLNEVKEVNSKLSLGGSWTPAMEVTKRDELYAGWKKAVSRTFDWC